MQNRTLISQTPDLAGQEVTIAGWVASRRDHGKLIFLDIRDHTGIVQTVAHPKTNEEAHKIAESLRDQFVVKLTGTVGQRPENLVNNDLPTGSIEIQVTGLEILNTSETPPFDLETDGYELDEALRMKHRYLDLRRARLQRNVRFRSASAQFLRNQLSANGFTEVETPLITASTPEGARDYVIPSRLHPGKFYALPQSPQQFKQLLMTAGADRYYQFARCMRDEDTRGDRQPEFTQLDMEMSFVDREEVMALNEKILIEMVATLLPEKRIQTVPFPRLSYKEAMEKYGNDRPDLRENKEDPNLLAFCWVIDFPFFEKTDDGGWTFTHNPFSAPKPEHYEWLMAKENIGEILTTQYDIALNGFEIGGGSIRNHRADAFHKVMEIMGYSDEQIANNFGHMIAAFNSGTPPHGGIAWGFDRLMTVFLNEPNIREVIAFPKTGDGRDLMMNAPSEISEKQLKELRLKIDADKK